VVIGESTEDRVDRQAEEQADMVIGVPVEETVDRQCGKPTQ
jgi:hypothetical protein